MSTSSLEKEFAIAAALTAVLLEMGYKETFGIGIYAKHEKGIVVDMNTGIASVEPYVDAPRDARLGWFEDAEALRAKLTECDHLNP